jgi:bifunctional UDP-N-acetylglucosamine pyrophosphorylase/glucosamine-1-phosphate N-acetyltransferase
MSETSVAVVVLAAGHGTRMKSRKPKVLHEIGGLSMLGHVIRAAEALEPRRLAVVVGDQAPEVGEAANRLRADATIAVQAPPRGTGDAVRCAQPALDGFDGVVLVLYADTPLLTAETLRKLRDAADAGAVLGFRPVDPAHYGRLVVDAGGRLEKIVEAKDASAAERAIPLANAGAMAARAGVLREYLPRLSSDNAKGEFYLTDVVALAGAAGKRFSVVEAAEEEVMGVNSRAELAAAERVFQRRRRLAAMAAGATLVDPDTVYFSHDTRLGTDVLIEPNVWFGPGVEIGEGATIRAFSHLEGARVGRGAQVGPFARLRPGAELGEKSRVGNFVEVKKAAVGEGAKINHLTYIGDAKIGARANIGAGTITCNYDGFAKHVTEIGADAFIGSNTALVAPVKVGRGAYVGSGSVITKPVADDALAVARGRQAEIKGWAAKFRASHEGKGGKGGHD